MLSFKLSPTLQRGYWKSTNKFVLDNKLKLIKAQNTSLYLNNLTIFPILHLKWVNQINLDKMVRCSKATIITLWGTICINNNKMTKCNIMAKLWKNSGIIYPKIKKGWISSLTRVKPKKLWIKKPWGTSPHLL
jgi:hypothetical protein